MNCSYFYNNTCNDNDNNINVDSFIFGSLLIISVLYIPVCCFIKFCNIKKEKNIIPGYTHIDSDTPPPLYNYSERNV